ncbi:MAG: Dabb family protein [Acidimicrobiales bacterium]
MFRWNDAADPESRRAVQVALDGLPAQIPEIRTYRFGPDAGIAEGNWDFVVVADFANQAGYEVYRDHPAHQAVIVDRIGPLVAQRAAVQMTVSDD